MSVRYPFWMSTLSVSKMWGKGSAVGSPGYFVSTWYADLYSEFWSRNSATVKPDDAKVEKSTVRVFAVASGMRAARKKRRIVNS